MAIDGILKLNVQLLRGGEPAIGPGKALLLEAIDRAASLSATGRELGMSYRWIWLLVDALNNDFREPVVETKPDSAGGAHVTAFGRELLSRYRTMEGAMLATAGGEDLVWLSDAMRDPV